MEQRTFPGPWHVDTTSGGHFVVKDANGLALAFFSSRRPSWLQPRRSADLLTNVRRTIDDNPVYAISRNGQGSLGAT